MTVDKRISYEVQGGAKNYLGKQKEVTAPIKWKSSPDSPETELAYITKAEKDLLVKKDLHGSLKNGVNRGPSGIMSLDGYGSFDGPDPSKDTGMSGVATSAAEAGGGSGADRRELDSYIDYGSDTKLPPGVNRKLPQDIQDYRNAFIAAGGGQRVNPGFFDSRFTVSPYEIRNARDYVRNRSRFKSPSLNPGLAGFFTGGGILGNLVRSLGQKFGLGKTYDQPTYDMSGINTRVYEGTMDPTVNPEYYNDLGNELLEKLAEEGSNNVASNVGTGFVTAKGPDFNTLLNQNKNKNTYNTSDGTSFGLDGYMTDKMFEEQFGTGPKISFDYNPNRVFEGILGPARDFLDNTSEDYKINSNNINAYQAKLATNSPALAQYRSLQKKKVLSNMGGPEFTIEDQRKLDMLEQMEADPNKVYSQTVSV